MCLLGKIGLSSGTKVSLMKTCVVFTSYFGRNLKNNFLEKKDCIVLGYKWNGKDKVNQ